MNLSIIKATIEVDCAIAIVLHTLAFGYSKRYVANIYCVEQSMV